MATINTIYEKSKLFIIKPQVMSTTKITDQEMEHIKAIQQKYTEFGLQLVQIELALAKGEEYLRGLNEQRDALKTQITELNQKEQQLADGLNERYGVGTLDMTTGEFTPNN